MRLRDKIAEIYWHIREGLALGAIHNRLKEQGHPDPAHGAAMEVYFRAEYLEGFRDFASAGYMRGLGLDELKTAFIKLKITTEFGLLTSQEARMLRVIIAEMEPDEAFHGEALAKHKARGRDLFAAARADAKILHGRHGRSPLTRRVLRGHA